MWAHQHHLATNKQEKFRKAADRVDPNRTERLGWQARLEGAKEKHAYMHACVHYYIHSIHSFYVCSTTTTYADATLRLPFPFTFLTFEDFFYPVSSYTVNGSGSGLGFWDPVSPEPHFRTSGFCQPLKCSTMFWGKSYSIGIWCSR